jgi:hypothetical protein
LIAVADPTMTVATNAILEQSDFSSNRAEMFGRSQGKLKADVLIARSPEFRI